MHLRTQQDIDKSKTLKYSVLIKEIHIRRATALNLDLILGKILSIRDQSWHGAHRDDTTRRDTRNNRDYIIMFNVNTMVFDLDKDNV